MKTKNTKERTLVKIIHASGCGNNEIELIYKDGKSRCISLYYAETEINFENSTIKIKCEPEDEEIVGRPSKKSLNICNKSMDKVKCDVNLFSEL